MIVEWDVQVVSNSLFDDCSLAISLPNEVVEGQMKQSSQQVVPSAQALQEWISNIHTLRYWAPGNSYLKDFVGSGKDKAEFAIYRMDNQKVDLSRAVCISVGGADGSDVRRILERTHIKLGLMLEYDADMADYAKNQYREDIKNAQTQGDDRYDGKIFRVIVGDAMSNLNSCRGILNEWRKEHNLDTIVVLAMAVLHEVQLSKRSSNFNLDAFFGGISNGFQNLFFYSREPSEIEEWTESVRFKMNGADGVLLPQELVAAYARFIAEHNGIDRDKVSTVHGDYVLAPRAIAAETIRKLLYLQSERELDYEIDEFHSAFSPEEIRSQLQSYFNPSSMEITRTNSSTFTRLYNERDVKVCAIGRDHEYQATPRAFAWIVGEKVSAPSEIVRPLSPPLAAFVPPTADANPTDRNGVLDALGIMRVYATAKEDDAYFSDKIESAKKNPYSCGER